MVMITSFDFMMQSFGLSHLNKRSTNNQWNAISWNHMYQRPPNEDSRTCQSQRRIEAQSYNQSGNKDSDSVFVYMYTIFSDC